MEAYPAIPGRGLVTEHAIQLRLEYLQNLGWNLDPLMHTRLQPADVQNNIESFFGAIEMPLGIVGPLLFTEKEALEWVYCPAGTLEGALVASMNRGARAVSLCGGFRAEVLHQRMVRAPMFMFRHLEESIIFKKWILQNFEGIRDTAEKYSNHAHLVALQPIVIGRTVHVKFVFETGDASGQNMTTTCTWHAMLWIVEQFQQASGVDIQHFVIEANGASDKKISHYAQLSGRGIHVTAECYLEDTVIQKVLRTSADDIMWGYNTSQALARLDGMNGFNINVANALAAIFVATGQDLGCLHESGTGILAVDRTPTGLYLSLNLPNLVVGTVGGGTHLSQQKAGLEIMGCAGSGKVQRFAKLIAGFALALEISTYSAIISGEFAKAHEKLGRNKPVNWLLKSEIDLPFVQKCLDHSRQPEAATRFELLPPSIDNGILTNITRKVNRKLMGFLPGEITVGDTTHRILIKSKPLDMEEIKGLHIMAASIDPQLSDLISAHKDHLEYSGSHLKELNLCEYLHHQGFTFIPGFWGKWIDPQREGYLLFEEWLNPDALLLLDSENSPERWTDAHIRDTLDAIIEAHHLFQPPSVQALFPEVPVFRPWLAYGFYEKLLSLLVSEEEDPALQPLCERVAAFLPQLEQERRRLDLPATLIHHDFNPRNVAVRLDGSPCIYDWELAVIALPHRDIVEFLSFVLPADFDKETLLFWLHHHHEQAKPKDILWEKWLAGYRYSLKEYLVTRVSFYKVAGILMKLKFSDRILVNALRMLDLLEE